MINRTKLILIRTLEIFVIILALSLSSSYIYFRYFKDTTFRVSEPLTPELSKLVDTSLDKSDVINGVQVVKIDLKRNVRYLIHTHWQTPELQKLYNKYSNDRITAEIPVFSKDDVENARIIGLMNHEFECTPFRNTLTYKLVPESEEHIAVICSISIPPAFNEFKGIIAASLSRVPTDVEKAIVKGILVDISDKIYKEIK